MTYISETRRSLLAEHNDPVALALRELRETDKAVSAAIIIKEAKPHTPDFNFQDIIGLADNVLDDAIFLAARSYDLEKEALGERDAIIDMLVSGAEKPLPPSSAKNLARHISTGRGLQTVGAAA